MVRRLLEPLATLLAGFEKSSAVLFTGHSSGAAIASLLYAHIMTVKDTPLSKVSREFSNIHCVVFGAPPISVRPLQELQFHSEDGPKSLFLSFLNEDDPIVHADLGAIAERCTDLVFTWCSVRHRRTSSSSREIIQRSRRFVLSGTTLLISERSGNSPQVRLQPCENIKPRMGETSAWMAHRVAVYQERITTLYTSMRLDFDPTGGTAINVSERPCTGRYATRRDRWLTVSCKRLLRILATGIWLAFWLMYKILGITLLKNKRRSGCR